MTVQRIYKGMPVLFHHDEYGWTQGVAERPSPNGEEWLVKIRGDKRWIRPVDLFAVDEQPKPAP